MAGVVRQSGAVGVQVVGAGALNQAIKAVAIARGYVAPSGIDLACVPTFADIEIDGQDRTAIRLLIESRSEPAAVDGNTRFSNSGCTSNGIGGTYRDGVDDWTRL